jgi:8-oxo-dGTP diphosphatase
MSDQTTPARLRRPEWPRPGASAAIIRDDAVLLIERGKGGLRGLWSLPGGHIEPGERALEAAAREVAEETGLTVTIDGLLDVLDIRLRNESGILTAHYVLTVYHGRPVDPTVEPEARSDAAAARFVPRTELAAYRLTPGLADVVAAAFARQVRL